MRRIKRVWFFSGCCKRRSVTETRNTTVFDRSCSVPKQCVITDLPSLENGCYIEDSSSLHFPQVRSLSRVLTYTTVLGPKSNISNLVFTNQVGSRVSFVRIRVYELSESHFDPKPLGSLVSRDSLSKDIHSLFWRHWYRPEVFSRQSFRLGYGVDRVVILIFNR